MGRRGAIIPTPSIEENVARARMGKTFFIIIRKHYIPKSPVIASPDEIVAWQSLASALPPAVPFVIPAKAGIYEGGG